MLHCQIRTRNKTALKDQSGNNVFDLHIRTENKAALNDRQFGNNVFDLQIRTRNKTALNDQFGNNVFHLQIRTGNKTVLNYQFGNNVFHLPIGMFCSYLVKAGPFIVNRNAKTRHSRYQRNVSFMKYRNSQRNLKSVKSEVKN